ncbi:hypothetical protein BOTBODRAFT_346351 [Botryobasidium botryosum FD-172 SS1]|uniref:Uncharacterized protein n=1 Tax=Botryobasidium botryosum (strain FD-172 SS1) TaxID=930990 RepID=A0A067MRT1_BOTB1|nr:hypothetical protein BOTBODRAFT_346351 [Botryobasidium botryosum FD-172 SS1]
MPRGYHLPSVPMEFRQLPAWARARTTVGERYRAKVANIVFTGVRTKHLLPISAPLPPGSATTRDQLLTDDFLPSFMSYLLSLRLRIVSASASRSSECTCTSLSTRSSSRTTHAPCFVLHANIISFACSHSAMETRVHLKDCKKALRTATPVARHRDSSGTDPVLSRAQL